MLRRNFLFVLIAGVGWVVFVGCRGEAARSAHITRAQMNSGAAVAINEAGHIPRNATHSRPLRRDTPHESFLSTYNNPEEGISFRYPRNYSLEEGDIEEHSRTWLKCFVTDDSPRFARLAERFLGTTIDSPSCVCPDELYSGALSQIITHYPERQATRMRGILAHSADEDRVLACDRQRRWILRMPRIVRHDDALSAAQDLTRVVRGHGPLELDMDCF